MGTDKRYDGYDSYSYLDAGTDYADIPLADEHAGQPYEVPLSEAEEARAEDVAAENTVVSFHEHAFSFPADIAADINDYVRRGRCPMPYESLANSPLDAVFDFHLDGLSYVHSKNGWQWEDIVSDVGMRACDVMHSDYAFRAEGVDDFERAREEGKLAVVPALESAAMIENDLDRIEILYGMGVRLMGITYTRSNALGVGGRDIHERDGGLTGFGAEAVERMQKVGMAVSTSHASPQTTLDACAVAEKPVFDTHTLTTGAPGGSTEDEIYEAVADTGGVIAVASSSTIDGIDTFFQHFDYLLDLVGPDHVAFGPDVLYGDHRELLRVLVGPDFALPEELQGLEYVKGLENPTEAWNNIVRRLVADGHDDETIEKVLGGNLERVLEEVWD